MQCIAAVWDEAGYFRRCRRDVGHPLCHDFDASGYEYERTDLAYKLLQCQQVIAALILQLGQECYQLGEPNQPAEDCLFVDVKYETLEKVFAHCKVFSLPQREERLLRLILPLAQVSTGEAAPPTTQNGLQNGRCVE